MKRCLFTRWGKRARLERRHNAARHSPERHAFEERLYQADQDAKKPPA